MKISKMSTVFLLGTFAALLSSIVHANQSVKAKTDKAVEKTGDYLSDTAITAKVKSKILASEDLNVADVSIETTQGEVWLSGKVDNSYGKEQVVALAKSIEGVKSVKNDLVY